MARETIPVVFVSVPVQGRDIPVELLPAVQVWESEIRFRLGKRDRDGGVIVYKHQKDRQAAHFVNLEEAKAALLLIAEEHEARLAQEAQIVAEFRAMVEGL